MKLRWSPRAQSDLNEIVEYIADDNLAAALEMGDRIYGLVQQLADHPSRGRPGRLAGSRELVVPGTPYLVIYRIGEIDVEVARVIHGARQWPPKGPR